MRQAYRGARNGNYLALRVSDRKLAYGHEKGPLLEDLQGRASGLALLTAAIGLWNAVYLERVLTSLRARGEEVPEEYLRHLSLLEWEHVTLTGACR